MNLLTNMIEPTINLLIKNVLENGVDLNEITASMFGTDAIQF